MATAVDGPFIALSEATWRSRFGYVEWIKKDLSLAEAITDNDTFLFTGGGNYGFGFYGGLDSQSFIAVSQINEDYIPEFVGQTFYPAGQGDPPETSGIYTIYPCPPQTMTEDLFTTGTQNVDNSEPTSTTYWFYNVDGVDGLTDQT